MDGKFFSVTLFLKYSEAPIVSDLVAFLEKSLKINQ